MRTALRSVASKGPHAGIAVLVLVVAVPMLWVVLASFRQGQVLTGGLFDFSTFGFGNYVHALTSDLPHDVINSVIASTVASVLAVAVGTITAYGFSRLRFRGARALLWVMLLIQLIPGASLVVPLYKLWGDLGLFNSQFGLALAYAGVNTAVCILLVKEYLDEIPLELDEAAAIDGCSTWTTFVRVLVPLLGPAMTAAGIFVFITTWQEFLIASSVSNDPSFFTLTVGLQQFQGEHKTDNGAILAGSVLTALPIIAIFAMFQRQFVSTIAGSTKG